MELLTIVSLNAIEIFIEISKPSMPRILVQATIGLYRRLLIGRDDGPWGGGGDL